MGEDASVEDLMKALAEKSVGKSSQKGQSKKFKLGVESGEEDALDSFDEDVEDDHVDFLDSV